MARRAAGRRGQLRPERKARTPGRRRLDRRRLLAAATVVVESWDKQPQNQQGIPDGCQKQNWGSPKYDLTIVSQGGERAIRLRSNNDSSTITKELKVDVR